MVYVLNVNKKPLMPCTEAKARKLLKKNKAKIVKYTPFVIQLLFECDNVTQKINLGVDTGSKTIGLSATTKEKELYSAEVVLRNDISKLLLVRKQNRRTRRSRLRYRKARFSNRVKNKKKGWLAPSIEHKIQTHLTCIREVHKILPISKVIVETAQFDIQKINNPEIEGNEYQKGLTLGFSNVKEYVLFRDKHTCQYCKGESKEKKLEVHHIKFKSQGGSDKQDNLIVLCKVCHKKLHNQEIELKMKSGKSFTHASFMGIMRNTLLYRLKNLYEEVEETYGYITKKVRIENNIPKQHRFDALCISGNPKSKPIDVWFLSKKVRCHNRQIHKSKILKGGAKKLNQAPYEVKGYRLFDKVEYEGREYFVFGRRSSGYFDIRDLMGNKIRNGSISCKELKLIEIRRTFLIEGREAIPLLA